MSKNLEKAITESLSMGLRAHLYTTKVVSRAPRGKTGIAAVKKQGR